MKFINRLGIFLLGFIMGIVGCIGGLVSGVYYAYTGLDVEDFTGVLTKEDIPILDENSQHNITQMTMEEIVTKFLALYSGDGSLTIANLEATYGLDFSMFKLTEEVRNMPLDKLLKGESEEDTQEFLRYITLGGIAELLSKTFGITFLDENYAHLFSKENGKLYYVTLADLFEEDGYLTALEEVLVFDLIPTKLYEGLPEEAKAALDAIGSISLADLLRAIIKNEGNVAEIIINAEGMQNLMLSDLIPEAGAPLKELLEGISFGDLFKVEDGEVKFTSEPLFKNITVYEVLNLCKFFGMTVEEIMAKIPDGEIKDQLNEIMQMSLYELMNSEGISIYIGDVTFGGVVDFILALVNQEGIIATLPEPIPTVYNKLAPIKLMDAINGLKNGDMTWLLDDALYTLTINDMGGYYVNPLIKEQKLPQPVPVIWERIKNFTFGEIATQPMDTIVNAVFSMTIADFFESYFYEGVYVWDEDGNYEFLYHFDEEGNKVAKMPAPLCAIFDQISKYSIQDIIDAYNCQVGTCGHTNPDECFTLVDMLGDSLYNITFGALLDEYVYDENGASVLPEGLTPIYEAIRNISVGDIVKVISGEESYEVLLKGLYELCIDDIAKYYLDWETLGLPYFVANIYYKIAFIKLGDIINNPMSIVDSLLSLTIDELIGEFVPEDIPDALKVVYNAVSSLTLQNIYDAIKDNSWYTLLKGLVDVSIDELLSNVLPEQIPAPLDKIYNSVKDITIGDIIRVILCESGNCDKAEWLYEENPHEYYTAEALLNRTLFTLTIADLLSGLNEETLAKLELFMQTIGTITLGELYRAMEAGFVRNDWTLLASLLEQKCQNATVGALFNPIIEIEIISKLHPIPFFVKALADEKIARFINMWKGFDDGYFIVEDSEAFFNKMLTGEEVIKVDIDFSKYMDAEHPVSLDFLIGFYIDMLSDELLAYNMDSLTENLFRPFEDITLGDIYRDYKVLLDALTKITVGDVFAEAFGFELNEWNKYYNANVSEVSNEIFNKLAPITIYDLIFGLDKLPEIQNIKLIDIFNLVADVIDNERNEYNQWSKGLRDFIEAIGQYTIGDLYNGRITSEDVAIALGEATISDILSILPQFRAIDNKLVDVLGSIQLVPLLYGDFVKALGTISIGEFIEAVAAAFGYEVDVAVELFRKLLRNSKLVLVSQIILVANGEESLEDMCGTLLKDIYVSDFVEMIYFYTAYADMPEVIKDSDLYGILETISIYGLIFDTENELYKLGDTSVADILNFVIDLYEEANDTTVTLPALINKLLDNLDAITARFILEGRTAEEYIKLVLNNISIDDLIGFLCETTGIEDIHNELVTYEIYNKIGAILLTELIYNPNAALETLKSIGIGDVLQMILNILGVYETLPNTVKKLIVNSAEMNYEYFQDVYTKKVMFTLFVNITVEDITNDIFVILNKEEVIDDEMLAKYYDFAENSILNDFLDTTIYNLIYNPQSLEETFKNTTVGDVVFTIADILIYLGYEDVADYFDQFGSLVKDAVILKLINAQDYVVFMFELFGTSRIIDVINIAEHFGWFFIYDDDDTTNNDIEHIANCFADIQLAAIITNFVPDELFGNYTVGDILAPSAGWELVTSSKEEGNINALAVVNAPIAGQTWTSGNEQLDEIINTKVADLINDLFSFVDEQYRLPLFFAVGAVAAVILYYVQELTLDQILSSIVEVPQSIKETKVYKAFACTSLDDFIEGTEQAELYKELTYGDLLDFIIAVIEEITATEINVADYPELITKIYDNLGNVKIFGDEYFNIVNDTFNGVTVGDIIECILELAKVDYAVLHDIDLYKKIGNILILDLINNMDKVIDSLYDVTIGDFIQIILIITKYEPYTELVDFFVNLDNVTIRVLKDAAASGNYETLLKIMFYDTQLTLITNAPVVKKNVPALIQDSKLYKSISEIYVLDLIFFNKEAIVNAIGDVTVGEIIVLVFDCFNSTIDEEYQVIKKVEENGKTVTIAQIVNNPKDNYAVILLTAVTYADVYNDFMLATGIKLELKAESQKLLDKVVLNMRNAYVAELFKSPMYIAVYEIIDGIILDEIFKVIAENLNKTIPEKVSGSDVYTKVAGISLRELIYNRSVAQEKVLSITVGEALELVVTLAAEKALTMNSVKKLISNLDAITLKEINKLGLMVTWIDVLNGITVEMITVDFQTDNLIDKYIKNPYNIATKNVIDLFNNIDLGIALNAYLSKNIVNYVFGSMTYGDVFDALLINADKHTNVVALVYTLKDVRIADGYNGIIENLKTLKFVTVIYAFTDFMPSNMVTVVKAYAALIDTAVIYNVITALRNRYYKAAVNELFDDADVGDVYGILRLYKIDVNANATSAYYSKFFKDVTLATILTDPTPENIFGSMTMDMVIGPMLRWTALSDGHYAAPEKHILKPLENVLVSTFLNRNFASLKPYMRTAVAGLIATHAIIFSYIIKANMPLINKVLNSTISEAMTTLNLRTGLGRYAIVIDKLVGEAVVADVLRCRTYKEAVITLFDDSTLMDVYDSLYMAGIYNINANETLSYYTHLFADCSIAEMLTDPKPAAFLQDITFGQMFGKFLNWTPANAEKTIWNGTGYFAPIANATLISLINRIPVINKLTPYQQSAVILGAGVVGVGLAYAYQLNAAKINAILNMTVADYCNRSGITKYINANPTNKLAITMKFVVDNLGSMTIRQLITDISKGYLNNILGDIYIGEIVDLVNALTGIVSKITAKNALYGTLIHNFDNVKLINVLAQKNINGLITVLFGSVTVKDFFQLRYEDSTWRFGKYTVFNALVEKDVDGVKVDVTVAELLRFALAGNYMAIIGNVTFAEAYKVFDPTETKLASAGAVGTIVYGFLDRNGNKTINEIMTSVKNGQFIKMALEGVKVEQLIDIIPAEKLDSLGFIKTALMNNKDMLITELLDGDVTAKLFAGMKLGEIMNYTYESGKWYMADSTEAGVIESIIADILVTDLIGGGFEIGTAFDGVKLGEIMGYTYDTVTNKWMNGAAEVDATTNIIANINMSDIMDGKLNLGDVFTGTKLGTLMGYSKNASDEWVDETDTALSAIMKMICDQDAGALFKGTVDFEALIKDMTLNEVLGLGSSATGIMAKFGALKIGEMSESKFRNIVNDLTIADVFIVGGVDNRAGLMKMLPADTKISEIGIASKDVLMTATLAELHANGIDIVEWDKITACAPKLGYTTAEIGELTLQEFITALIIKVMVS